MNRTNIEFADFTLNPIVGCQNSCSYCWARKFNDRYFKNNNFTIPKFYPERLNDKIPGLPKKRNYIAEAISPDKPVIFLVDMGDIFSDGVEKKWNLKVFIYGNCHQSANFLYISKQPKRFLQFFNVIEQDNSFIGTSLDFAHNAKRLESIKAMGKLGFRTFVNIEPLMSRMDMVDFSGIDFLIVGALTGQKYQPQRSWHEGIKHDRIYYKNNYLAYFPELKTK